MKLTLFLMALTLSASTAFSQSESAFYSFKVKAIDGTDFDLGSLKGKKVMVVNTASKCGLTPQYEELEELYKNFSGSGDFVIIGFPANNFMNQEPGTDEEIQEFCSQNYGVTFPMMSKISVKGKDIHPLYEWLTTKDLNGVMDANVSWNFQKFLIDEKGNLAEVIPPREKPMSDKVLNWINGR
ncbi:MAG: glutathione peroxidase [Bacteroidales bacterium]